MRTYNYKISERANKSLRSLRKRKSVARMQKGILAISVVVLIAFGILLGTSINAFASSQKDISSYNKYYTSIRIESGDTLWNIADKYIAEFHLSKSDYIAEVCELNGISENNIQAGDYIIVPYFSQEIK